MIKSALISSMMLVLAGLYATPALAGPVPKVTICHLPPGNPTNYQTITVAQTALAAHLAHGDFGGACDRNCAVVCNDGNACTRDDCDANGCKSSHPAVNCDDGNLCTTDSCNPTSGCVNTPVQCEAPDVCTISQCAPDSGDCVNSPVDCPEGQACDSESGECVVPGSPCDGVTCPAGETCIPTADPLCQPEQCGADWTCGQVQPTCGSSGPLEKCLCDVTVEGDPYCWEDYLCDSSSACTNSSDCPAGWKCVTDCCETSCAPPCNGGLQNSGLRTFSAPTPGQSASGN